MNPSQRKQNQSSITKYFTPQPSENTSQENPSPENETHQDLNPSDETVDSQSSEDIKNVADWYSKIEIEVKSEIEPLNY